MTLRSTLVAILAAVAFVAVSTDAMAQLSHEDYCRAAAKKFADQQAAGSAVTGAVIGALIGGALGAIVGGRNSVAPGAAIGAGAGAITGAASAAAEWRRRYGGRYNDCLAGYWAARSSSDRQARIASSGASAP